MTHGYKSALPRLRSLALALHAAWGLSAFALPQGATVVNGQVQIAQPSAGAMQINASNGAIINWRQFSIGAGESAQFVQPSSTSAVLNRVVGRDLSELMGQLKSNGQVFLINPNGIVIGGAARIDTNSFIASTLDIADADFLAGKLRFLAQPGAGGIRNEGLITAGPNGRIALIAPDIENSGIIHAPDGNILLAAGRKLEIASMDLDGIRFEVQAPTDAVLNLGQLLADNGAVRVFAGTIRHSGEVRANRMAVDADGSIVLTARNNVTLTADSAVRADGVSGGSIVVQASEGTARVQGVVSAAGSAGAGGDIRILGERVALESGARISASGSSGGGQILVGGDFQGGNAAVQNAKRVFVGEGARLEADAGDHGDGGRIIVWADENTRFGGSLSARGGAHGGDGGFAEVSGKANLAFTGHADLGAAHGASGSLLLDPLDILVSLTSGILPIVVDEFADFASNVVTISPLTLAAVGGNVVLQAVRDIYVRDPIALTASGAGVSMTAGGAMFDAGSIFMSHQDGITTNGGAVTLRAQSISGPGGITTAGGAVDLMTSDSLAYSAAIASGGGNVTLAAQDGSIFNANVDAGSGAIQVSGNSISSGSFTTSGSASLTATSGSIFVNNLNAGVANLTASSTISASVSVADRVNATSTGSSVSLSTADAGALRIGTVSGNSGVFLSSFGGMEQVAGGVITAPLVRLDTNGSTAAAGSAAAPIQIASPSAQVQPIVQFQDVAAPVHVALLGGLMLGGLELSGTVAGLASVSLAGASNLTTLTLANVGGVLNLSAVSNGGLANGFSVNVTNGRLNAALLTLPGAPVELFASTAIDIGTMTGDSLVVSTPGAVTIGSATTTGSFGIDISTGSCNNNFAVACATSAPIVAGTLDAQGTGSVDLRNRDNGDISVTNLSAGRDVEVDAGNIYTTSFNFPQTTQRTTNNIVLGTVVVGDDIEISNRGSGNVTVTSLAASGEVYVEAGGNFSPTPFSNQLTTNTITIGSADPMGANQSFRVYNSGIGNVTVTGNVDRSVSGDIDLYAEQGSVSALGNLAARFGIYLYSGTGTVALGQLVSGVAADGDVSVQGFGDVSFRSITSTGAGSFDGNVFISSSTGSVATTQDDAANDIVATGNVTIQAGTTIGNSMLARPMDILAGASKSVTLTAGLDIGTAMAPVNIDTSGTVDITSTGGQFHVVATDGMAGRSLSTVRLSASAAGIGNGGVATFRSADLDVDAASDGAVITIGDPMTGNLERSAGTLNEFRFAATGTSGLLFGNVILDTAGSNKLILSSSNGLTQTSVLTNSIVAAGSGAVQGTVELSGGAGATVTGDISAWSVVASGASLALGNVTTSGTRRASNFGNIPDKLNLTASGDIVVSGNLTSATVIDASAGGNVTVTGTVTGTGSTRNTSNAQADRVRLNAGGDITTGGAVSSLTATAVTAGGAVDVGGNISGGTNSGSFAIQQDVVTVTAGAASSIDADAIVGGYSKTVSGGTLNVASGITGGSFGGTTVNATTFNTGNLQSAGALTINATGAYAPGSAIALSAGSSATITAQSGIDLVTGMPTVTAPTVTLDSSSGDISASLTNTNNLTIRAGGRFNVTSSVALTNVAITADGLAATAPGGSNASGTGQALTVMDGSVAINLMSPTAVGFNYTETNAAVTDITLATTGALGNGSQVTVNANNTTSANISTPSVTMGSGAMSLLTTGDINLTSVTTGGASVNVNTSGGTVNLTSVHSGGGPISAVTQGDATRHVNVDDVVSLGGSVTLSSANGNIVGTGAASIDAHNGMGQASGTTDLRANNGSVGSAATPINMAGAASLVLRARDAIEVDVTGARLTNLTITTQASGAGLVDITGSGINFDGLAITRSGADLLLNGLNPFSAGAFSLTAVDGNIVVGADIANVTNLTLNAGNGFNTTGDLRIQAGTGPRSVAAGSYNLRAGQDVLITAGATAMDTVSVSQSGGFVSNTVIAGRDILVTADGGTASLSQGISTSSQTVSAGRDLRVTGGSAGVTGAFAEITAAGSQSLGAGGNLVVQAGTSDGATARIAAATSQSLSNSGNVSVTGGGNGASAQITAGTSQFMTAIGGMLSVQGGTGTGAFAEIVAGSSQNLGRSSSTPVTNLLLVQGGTGSNAYASLRSGTNQEIQSSGDVRVLGSATAGSYAEIRAGTSQTLGSTALPTCCSFNDPTAEILVQAGAGGTAAILAGGQQTILASERIRVLGGSGTGMSARIETTAGGQTIGNASTFQNDPTGDILVQGGSGDNAFASIKAPGTQTIRTGGTISVLGSSGMGASAEIVSTAGAQTIGSTSTSNNDATDSIVVQAGSGGIARIMAQSTQTIMTGGDLTLQGGPSAGMTASIESTNGFQSIGNTSTSFGNDPSGAIRVLAGAGTGSAAFIKAATGQTIDAGGVIELRGAGPNAYAEITSSAGNQAIGNVNFNRDRTDNIVLAGGTAAGSYARVSTPGFLSLSTSQNLSLTGGAGDNAGAALLSGTGQSLTVQGSLAMVGGSGSAPGLNETAIRNNTSGSQSINVTGNMSVTGGGFGSDTWVKQNGTGNQSITVGGDLALLAPASTPSTGVTSIESLGFAQNIFLGGALSIDNQAGWLTYIASSTTQTIGAGSIAISLSTAAPVTGAFAGITSSGNQTINLHGDGTTIGTATLSLVNTSSLGGSSAAIKTAADQVILMDYDSAGLVRIGSTDGLGATEISAQGTHTMVAGQLLIQGGASSAATAGIYVPNGAAVISTIYGPIELLGGALGAAIIDPPQLDMVSNAGVFLLAGPGSGADATITAGTFNLAATSGDLSLVNSSAAVAAINATVFNYFGNGNVNLNGGTITVTQAGTITINGTCFGCDTNLIGPFTVSAFIPPPLDFGALVTADLLALADLAAVGVFDVFFDEDGNLVLSNRRLNQCY